MRIAKEIVVNFTVNEFIRNRVTKLEEDLFCHSEKNMRFCVKLIQSPTSGQGYFKKKMLNTF